MTIRQDITDLVQFTYSSVFYNFTHSFKVFLQALVAQLLHLHK